MSDCRCRLLSWASGGSAPFCPRLVCASPALRRGRGSGSRNRGKGRNRQNRRSGAAGEEEGPAQAGDGAHLGEGFGALRRPDPLHHGAAGHQPLGARRGGRRDRGAQRPWGSPTTALAPWKQSLNSTAHYREGTVSPLPPSPPSGSLLKTPDPSNLVILRVSSS